MAKAIGKKKEPRKPLWKMIIANDCPWCEQPVGINVAQQAVYKGEYPDGWFHRQHQLCYDQERAFNSKPVPKEKE